MITIIDYNIGNLTSIQNMLKKAGVKKVVISGDPKVILEADKLILPGVGHFDYGMKHLKESGLIEVLNNKVLDQKTPLLGICLGAQLLTTGSDEGTAAGLGWINAHTSRFDKEQLSSELKIPHMGWSDVQIVKASGLFEGMEKDENRFYFVHSYHITCQEKSDELVTADYGYRFTAGVERNNIMGVQFHPEKSHKFGMRLLYNFATNY
jgi:imidazole glycerol-phosphate synthase subunit HisH